MKKIFLLMRFVIYFSVLIAPLFSPAVVVPYDLPMLIICFLIVPFEALSAYLLSSVRIFKRGFLSLHAGVRRKLILPLIFPFIFMLLPSYQPYLFFSLSFSAAAFFSTYLLFRFNTLFLSFVEAVFYFFIYYRLIGFSSQLSMENPHYSYITAFYFVVLIFSYFLTSFFYYRGTEGGSLSEYKREYTFLILIFIIFAVPVFVFLPDGSRSLDFILNFSNEKAITDGGEGGVEDEDANADLKGVPSDRWGNRSRRGGSGNKQYAVMIVSSKKGEVYSAWEYLDRLDPVKGFLFSDNEVLNNLKNERFVENWINPDLPYDSGRDIISTFYLSALPERSVPYLPFMIEPTVYDTSVSPFSYSYRATSFISVHDIDSVSESRELYPDEKDDLSLYLESEIDIKYRDLFNSYIDSLDLDNLSPGEKIGKILKSFENYQYEIGFDENTSIEKLKRFILKETTGDCTEFSNTAAVLGRIAGIPSRVVHGYLASENLQTPSHDRGIVELQKNIKALQSFSPDELLLVTTAHRHAWVQYYLADYGWIDFETTGFAIPPSGMDMNAAQVVVPIIRTVSGGGKADMLKGWLIVFKLLLFSSAILAVFLYVYKYSRLSSLLFSRGPADIESAGKKYRYILLKHYLSGYPVKMKYMTPLEYSRETGGGDFKKFSSLYTEICFKDNYAEGEFESLLNNFSKYFDIVRKRLPPSGFRKKLSYFFSLRGIFY